ncbi:MAG: sulfatase-like hydrolase/transferase, partial [Solirubrobacterales bacterium]
PGGVDQPFFLDLWLSAPHAPYIAATRHTAAFSGAPVPRNNAVNERNTDDKPRFLRRLKPLRRHQLATIQERQRQRWAQLLSVVEGIANVVDALKDVDELDDTYIVFTSDNGYFSGEHRIAQGKYLPMEPSSHVPLLIRGPGIPAAGHSAELASNVDVAPTIAAIAGASPKLTVDGRSLLPYARNPALRTTRPLLLEGDTGSSLTGGEAIEAGKRASGSLDHKAGVGNLEQEPIARIAKRVRAPAYRAIRTDRYLFVRYAKGGVDLYDMSNDPLQLRSRRIDSRYRAVRAWLAAALNGLQGCAGATCNLDIGPDPVPLASPARRPGAKSKSESKSKPRKEKGK